LVSFCQGKQMKGVDTGIDANDVEESQGRE